jgi:hypothetical protein
VENKGMKEKLKLTLSKSQLPWTILSKIHIA